MPVIDDLIQQGTPHDVLLRALAEGGLAMSQDAFRKALYRWRKRSRKEPAKASGIQPAAVPGPQPTPPTAQTAPRPPISDITNKGDLVRLRESRAPIDLNQLAQLGRKK